MEISPDSIVLWQWGFVSINMTIVSTWGLMFFLVGLSFLVTRKLSTGPKIGRLQSFLEGIVELIQNQIKDVIKRNPDRYLPLLGTLALFIGLANLLTIVPLYEPPTGSLSTTAALAVLVFFAVPFYGIREIGMKNYLKNYIQPNPIMLPFNVFGELSRTLAMAVRLFGNIMSGKMIIAILLSLAPLFFPILMRLLGLLTGMVQAFIFFILAAVYIGANMDVEEQKHTSENSNS